MKLCFNIIRYDAFLADGVFSVYFIPSSVSFIDFCASFPSRIMIMFHLSNGSAELYLRHHDDTKCFPDVSSLFSYLAAARCNFSCLLQFIYSTQLQKRMKEKELWRHFHMKNYVNGEKRKLINFSSAAWKLKNSSGVERKWESGMKKEIWRFP